MPFTFSHYELSGLVLIEQKTFEDPRGFFKETYQYEAFAAQGIGDTFVQDNLSVSARDVLRGLHFQIPPMAQAKLVSVIKGTILDVVVDLRKNSPTFQKWAAIELAAEKHQALYIPLGFAHGFLALENDSYVSYKTSAPYSPEHERGLRWNDPDIGIVWPIASPQLSAKDAKLPFIGEITNSVF